MTTIEEVTIGAFSPPLVAMSFIISVLGSWVGLTCANRARKITGTGSWLWLFGAATSIGGGAIWSMHFIGMLAFDSHVAYALDVSTTLISLAVAIVAAMVGMLIATAMRGNAGYIVGGLVTGAGMGAMHYTGMYAMTMSATMVWKPPVVVISIIIALAASALALFFAFTITTRLMRVAAAVMMGIGVCVMHYTGMLALEIHSTADDKLGNVSGADPVYLAMPIFAISAGMLIVIGFANMFAGINDDIEGSWTPGRQPTSDSGSHPMTPQRPAMAPLHNSGQQPALPQQPQPLQPLPTRQPAASGSPQANQPAGQPTGEGIGGMFAQRPQRPTQLRPQNGRWTPRPYAQQASAQQASASASEPQPDFFRPRGGQPSDDGGNEPQAQPQQARPQRTPGWLPPRDNNL